MRQNRRTMTLRSHGFAALLALAAVALMAAPAHAGLGAGNASVLADAHELHGAVTLTLLQQYDIREISGAGGMRVREFLNRAGVVFALSWSGPVVPDLARLLGTSYASYAGALAALQRRGLHRSVRIAMPDLVVELGGHLRAYVGHAYLPALIPPGIQTADLR